MKATAVFLDRDGTIMDDIGYAGDPDQVRLIPGAADAIRRFRECGYVVVVVSNQSGVARGLFDETDLSAVHSRLESLLEAEGTALDGAYYCPYLDGAEAKVEAYRRDSELRKPSPGMLLQAAKELNVDLAHSWMIGNSACDIEAGSRAGCRTILIRQEASEVDAGALGATWTVASLGEAAAMVERNVETRPDENEERFVLKSDEKALRLLGDIRDLLDRAQRRQRQLDFSLLRLFGALLQMFAVVAGLWGIWGLFGEEAATATARFGLACFLQLASISAFAIDRFR
jgi:D-glycero-D-manno-heptose 1,7-bisphosphate phosphatase